MLVSCENFQEVEIEHLRKMKSFIETYAKSAESNHTLIQQVHVEFKQQADEQTVEKLVDQFILVKSTGIEKPGPIEFEEVDLSNLPPAPSPDQQEKINVANDNKAKEKGLQRRREINNIHETAAFGRNLWQLNTSMSSNGQTPAKPMARGVLRKSKSWFLSRTKREKKKKKKKEAAAAAQAHVETVEKKEEDCCVNDASSERNSITSKDSKESSKTPEVDEEGFTIRPENINTSRERRVPYDSSGTSDSDSDDDEQKKFTVNIRPLGHSHPIAASVDELRATVERMSLSPVTVASPHERKKVMIVEATMKRSQSLSDPFSKPSSDLLELEFQGAPPNSAASTPTGAYSGVKSPPLNAPSSGHSTPVTGIDHQVDQEVASFPPPVPKAVSGSSIAIPRPPSRSRERPRTTTPGMQQHGRGRMSPAQPVMARADSVSSVGSVGSESFKTTSAPVSCSRGPSPLALGMADTVPLAVAFTETIHAYFKGVDETKCKVKIQGYMLVSFPAGIVQVLANNPNLTPLSFRLRESSRIEGIVLNRQLVSVDAEKSAEEGPVYAFDMATLRDHLKRQAESSPSASFFNVDIMKYQVKAESGAGSCPLHLRSHWRCDDDTTSLRVDYRYHQAGAHGCTLTQIACVVTVDGGVTSLQAIPQAAWASDTQRVTWKLATLNQHSESSSGASGGGALRAKFALNNGPSTPSTLAAQFVAEGRTLSGADAELVGPGYRLSLVKRRYAAGKYYCDADVEAKYS
ncbi:PREDICTED: F-BAR domain only protein 2-like isoform X2 [Priapulus caudatus]|uniref:F-BAR domain only protein 2-like isoform X2 n=1 Tax=Priapulus caudatus TaxID=37621 RepID=A0ABM1DR18_PRICU|nr:PREDICTED: F-BAR domain only protein 2-like isoform X2 [Priapulus caudatus]